MKARQSVVTPGKSLGALAADRHRGRGEDATELGGEGKCGVRMSWDGGDGLGAGHMLGATRGRAGMGSRLLGRHSRRGNNRRKGKQ